MAIMIAMAWSEDCEKELLEKGFKKREFYCKDAPLPSKEYRTVTEGQIKCGEAEFFQMKNMPFQFLVDSWWGSGPD